MKKLPFLSKLGLFTQADRTISDNLTIEETQEKCASLPSKQAILYAEKAAIIFGIPGLKLYFPLIIQELTTDKHSSELIEIQLIKVLSIMKKIEIMIPKDEIQIFSEYKKSIYALIGNNLKVIEEESSHMATLYKV